MVRTEDRPECYAWSLTDFARVMGYLAAETRLTLKNMDCVLAEIKEGKCHPAEEAFEELAAKYGLERREPDPEAEEKERAIRAAGYEYDLFCRNRAIERVRESLYAADAGLQNSLSFCKK